MLLRDLLEQMDRAAANLSKLERIWERASQFIPQGPSIGSHPEYDDLARSWDDLLEGLPLIDGWTIREGLPDIAALGQGYLDYAEIGEVPTVLMEEAERPASDIAQYRHRLNRSRRRATRSRIEELIGELEGSLSVVLSDSSEMSPSDVVDTPATTVVREAIAEADRLLGDAAERTGRWSDLRRHLHFSQVHDWSDIAEFDWPSVRLDLEAAGFSEADPLPVATIDLGEEASTRPSGGVSTSRDWSSLTAEGFERLLFDLLRAFEGHENVRWLTSTRAPDRGRDLSLDRVIRTPTGAARRERVLVQAKHWLSKAVSHTEVAAVATTAEGWNPPFDVVIVATSGRFTTEAVTWTDQRATKGTRPDVELWANSDLEAFLARHPGIAAGHGLASADPPSAVDPSS